MARKELVHVIGCGGHAKVVISALRAVGFTVSAIYDDDRKTWGGNLLGIPVAGPVEAIRRGPRLPTIIAVGHNATRRAISERLELDWLTVVHPRAHVDPSARVGRGVVVMAGAVIQTDAEVGDQVIINTAASVDHDCRLGNYVHVAPGGVLAGNVELDAGVLFGAGASSIPGVRVGGWAVVGAGAVVAKDVPREAVAMGVPARVVREDPAKESPPIP